MSRITNTCSQLLKAMSEIQTKIIEWLWYPYIAMGKLTILQGAPGCGKTWIAIDLAARISSGGNIPLSDVTFEPSVVLYQTAEDGIEDTIKPRLERSGANCQNIYFIDALAGSPLTLVDSRLEEAVSSTGAKLLVIDTLSAFLTGSKNDERNVRIQLEYLSAMAERTGVAVLLITHTTKTGKDPISRTAGSVGVAGVVRSILYATKGQNDQGGTEQALLHVKNNLERRGPAMFYEPAETVIWTRACDLDPDTFYPADGNTVTKLRSAEDELVQLLWEQKMPAKDVIEYFKSIGASARTVNTAKANIGVKSIREGNCCYWYLPDAVKAKYPGSAVVTAPASSKNAADDLPFGEKTEGGES